MEYLSPLHEMSCTTPTQFWNDSCSADAIKFAMKHGAVGATTNPVIVGQVMEAEMDKYIPVIKKLAQENPLATEDDITWLLNERMAVDGAELLYPAYKQTEKKAGYISIQVNTKYYRNTEKIIEQAVHFGTLAENIMVKIPATAEGIKAIEEVTFRGVNVNATVSFTVAQAVAVAEAITRGLERRSAAGLDNSALHPVCTIMVGRVEDWLKEVAEKQNIIVDPQAFTMSGVAVFKNAYRIYNERGYNVRLLAAAVRHHHHWSEFMGGDISITIPPLWIKRFAGSDITVENRMDSPVEPRLIAQLKKHFPDFDKAYEPDGMKPEEFVSYGASARTLEQFFSGYDKAVGMVRGVLMENR